MKRIVFIIAFAALVIVAPAFSMAKNTLQFAVQGVDGKILENVRSRLTIDSKELDGRLGRGSVRGFAAKSVKSVKEAISPYGYFTPRVRYHISREGKAWLISYTVSLGQPVKIKRVDVKLSGPGAKNRRLQKFKDTFPIKVGQVFNSADYTSARDRLFDIANNQGYIKAKTDTSKVLVNTKTMSAEIVIHLDTGPRYYWGDLYFNDTPYSEKFMTRFNIFNRNKHFSSEKLLAYQQDMNNSRYFKQVLVVPDIEAAENYRVPIHASVVPINDHRYTFGLGYGTFTGVRFTAGIAYKRLTSMGHSASAQVKLSQVLSGVAMKYFIPGKNPLTEEWNVGLNFSEFRPKTGNSRSKTLSFGYSNKMKRWTFSANLNFLVERYLVNNAPPPRNSILLYPNARLSYLKVDDIIRPKWGRSMSVMLQGASKQILSSTSFIQGEVKGKLFMTPLSFMHIILRGDLGYSVVNDLNELPLSMRFFAGGINSIRGFQDSGIGPGKYLGVASAEYRNHITENFSAAVFYDIGTATNHFGDPPLSRGAGVGLIYESPVGPIRLYAARALSKKGMPHSFEFSIGPEF